MIKVQLKIDEFAKNPILCIDLPRQASTTLRSMYAKLEHLLNAPGPGNTWNKKPLVFVFANDIPETEMLSVRKLRVFTIDKDHKLVKNEWIGNEMQDHGATLAARQEQDLEGARTGQTPEWRRKNGEKDLVRRRPSALRRVPCRTLTRAPCSSAGQARQSPQ